MRIEQGHQLGQVEAIGRIDRFLDELMQQPPPGGLTVKDASKTWDGNRMTFSFTAAKGMFGTSIQGAMEVTDCQVVLESELPGLVRNFIGEDRVKDIVSRELGKVLA